MSGCGPWLRRLGFLAGLILAGPAPASAQTPWTAPSSEESVAVIAIVTAVANAELGEPIQFSLRAMRLQDGWIFIDARPFRPDDLPIHWEVTRYAEAYELGRFEERVRALFRETPVGWLLFEYDMGSGAAVLADWLDRHDVPPSLLQ